MAFHKANKWSYSPSKVIVKFGPNMGIYLEEIQAMLICDKIHNL